MSVRSIRGATTVEADGKDEVLEATRRLLRDIIAQNQINIEDVISIFFSCTSDITSVYPAVAAREMGFTACGIMCFQEMDIWGSLPSCIRVMLLVETDKGQKDIIHVYHNEAKKLRPDLYGEEGI